MGYSKRCNQSTGLNSATEELISHLFIFKRKPLPRSAVLAVPLLPGHGAQGYLKVPELPSAWDHTFAEASRQNPKSQPASQTATVPALTGNASRSQHA